MFYFDKELKEYETTCSFASALQYLEKKYKKQKNADLLNSLIASSWYYFIEGPVDNKKYEKENTSYSFGVWKKYTQEVASSNDYEATTLYICGYTLSLHGFLIDEKMENIGKQLINKALTVCHDNNLKELIMAFIAMDNQKKYRPIKLSDSTLSSLFNAESMVGRYFIELYKQKNH